MKKILALSFLVAAFGVACSSTPKDPGVAGVNPAHPEERLPAADTDTDLLVEGGRVNLDKCGGRDGYAFMKRESNGQLVVYADNLECAYYQTPFSGGHQKLNGSQGRFNMRFVVDESAPGWHELVLGSKNYFTERTAGAKADIVRFYVPPRVVTLIFSGAVARHMRSNSRVATVM